MDIRKFFNPGGAKSKPKERNTSTESAKPAKVPTTRSQQKETVTHKKSDTVSKPQQKETAHEKKPADVKPSSKNAAVSGEASAKKTNGATAKAKPKKDGNRNRRKIEDEDLDDFICDESEESAGSGEEEDPLVVIEDSDDQKEKGKKKSREKKHEVMKFNQEIFSVGGDSDEEREIVAREDKKKRKVKVPSDDDEDEMPQKRTKKPRGKKAAAAKKAHIIEDSDSDAEMIPPSEKKRKPRKKKEIMAFSSDEERPNIKSAFEKMKPKSTSVSSKPSASSTSPTVKKPVANIADFFGSAPVHRTEPKATPSAPTPTKRKAESSPLKPVVINDEEDIFDDGDDFETTLELLDQQQLQQPSKKVKLDVSPKKETKHSPLKAEPASPQNQVKGTSLASKLASKAKGVVYVGETPEKQPPKAKTTPKKTSPMQISPAKKSPTEGTPAKSTSPGRPTSAKVSPVDKPSLKKGTSTDNEDTPQDKRKGNAAFRSYLNREGPKHLGSKELPVGAENCLEGLTFVITGVLDSIERDEGKTLVERYGGKVTTTVSKKTDYIVVGSDAGVSKMAKAEQFKTKQLDEDGLFDLIRTKPGKKSKYEVAAEQEAVKEKKVSQATPKSVSKLPQSSSTSASPKIAASPSMTENSQSSQSSQLTASPQVSTSEHAESLLWVDKYKPSSMKQIIGQQGDKSNARKLLHWLKSWHRNIASGKKPAFNRFNDDGSGHRAALLSGPPGVGKTTTAQLVCEEAGFSFVELNASCTRSKRSMQETVAELLGSYSLTNYFGPGHETLVKEKHCLIMDEVDGMAGNEDRGGMQELIQLIKNTKIPIITMCNDRNHQKVRSLANYCFDLRFQKPRLEQIKAAMMSMAFKEGIKIPPPALNEMILASNQDIRQVIHNLSMWSAGEKNMNYDQVKKDADKAKKDMKLGPFDVVRKVFSGGEETAGMTIHDKSDLFFHDYSFGPLFVQENYIHVQPYAARGNKKKHLDLLSQAADSLCDGDMVDQRIRRSQAWSLLPLQAIFASVIPGDTMRGVMQQQISFPSWLGKNSSTGKSHRILQDLRSHMTLHISADKRALNMDYLPHFRNKLTLPLVKRQTEGVSEVIELMDNYNLLREDFDSILEVTTWPGARDPMSSVETKTKSAFTRAYNKEVRLMPYADVSAAKKKGRGRGGGGGDEMDMMGEDGEPVVRNSDEEDSDNDDGMIKKAKKKPEPRGKKGETSQRGGAKGRGRGRGAGRGKKK